jgi:predicted nuclease of predicted toxin-antitoxin system
VKLLIDMNLSPRWVDALADAGIESTHWSTIGAPTTSDPDIMAFAKTHGYVVLTHDLDFGAILAATHGDKPSVVQIRAANLAPEVIAADVITAVRQLSTELEAGALLTVEPGRTRARLLPLEPR